ncbi:type II toxin-antitoxin system RelE/ParE family toxin [Rhizobium binxianense]
MKRRYRVLYRETAREDLRAIFDCVVERSRNRVTAGRYVTRIRGCCERIGDAPFGGVARPDIAEGLSMAVFERSVVILYAIIDGRVEVTNVITQGKDYQTLLGEEN